MSEPSRIRTVVLTITPKLRRKPAPTPIEQSRIYREFQDAMDRTRAIVTAGPDEIDLLQRTLLCRATGQHDPRLDGTCRDCEADTTGLACCPPDARFSAPDEEEA